MTDKPRKAIHFLKVWPQFFEPIARGQMPFDVRKNDRDFRAGDKVVMYEWIPENAKGREAEGYTGREVRGNILHVMRATDVDGLGPEYVVLGIEWTDGIYPKVGT